MNWRASSPATSQAIVSGGSVAVSLPADVAFGVASTDVINRLADLPIKSRIRAASSGSAKLQLMAELKRLRNQRGLCAVCPKPLSRTRSVYCSDRCARLWGLDTTRIKKATSEAEAAAVNVACCESAAMRDERPEKQPRRSSPRPTIRVHQRSLWARCQIHGRSVTVCVPIQAITDELAPRPDGWLDTMNIDLCALRLLADRMEQVVEWRLRRAGVSARTATSRALRGTERRFKCSTRVDPALHELVAVALVATGCWVRGTQCNPVSGYVSVDRVRD